MWPDADSVGAAQWCCPLPAVRFRLPWLNLQLQLVLEPSLQWPCVYMSPRQHLVAEVSMSMNARAAMAYADAIGATNSNSPLWGGRPLA